MQKKSHEPEKKARKWIVLVELPEATSPADTLILVQ
jgi:hypothetical protein